MGISVIIPAFNAERYLAATVESVLAQRRADWDLTIVDDGSRDQTGSIARQFAATDPRIRAVHQGNRGLGEARNAGLAASTAAHHLALFLDADDLLEPDALGVLARLLESSPGAVAAHGAARLIDQTGAPLDMPDVSSRRSVPCGANLVPVPPDQATTHEMLAVDNYIQSAGAVIVLKAALQTSPVFDQSIAASADHDLWFRLTRHAPIPFTPEVVLAYRVHPSSMSRHRGLMRAAGLRMRRKWIATAADPTERELVYRGYRLSVRETARGQRRTLLRHLASRQWQQLLRAVPLAAFCSAKALPGVSRLILASRDRRIT